MKIFITSESLIKLHEYAAWFEPLPFINAIITLFANSSSITVETPLLKYFNQDVSNEIPYLPYIFGRIKIIIFFTVRTFNLEKNYKFFSVRIFINAENLPIIEGIHQYICGNFNVYTDRCENKKFVYF